tara:strand:+ start:243 stop:392 length:150 start_codon:yes stop_codon:yes gene_type:complete
MNHQVYRFLQRFIRFDLTFFDAFIVGFLRLVGFVCFAAMVEQVCNVMAD